MKSIKNLIVLSLVGLYVTAPVTQLWAAQGSQAALTDDIYLEVNYFTKVDVDLLGEDTTYHTHIKFYPMQMRVTPGQYKLSEMLYTGVFHCFERDGLVYIKKINLDDARLEQYFCQDKNTETSTTLESMPYDTVELWYRNTTTGQETCVSPVIDLSNEVPVPLTDAEIASLGKGGQLECRVKRNGADRTGFFYEAFQMETACLDKLLKYHLHFEGEKAFGQLRSEFKEAIKKDIKIFMSIDEEALAEPLFRARIEELANKMADKVLDYEMRLFVSIEELLAMDNNQGLNDCVEMLEDGLYEVTKPIKFKYIINEIVQNSEHHTSISTAEDNGINVTVPIKGIPVGIGLTNAQDDKIEEVRKEHKVVRGEMIEEGYTFSPGYSVELKFIDSRCLEVSATFDEFMEIISPSVAFYQVSAIPFTGSVSFMAPYGSSPLAMEKQIPPAKYSQTSIWSTRGNVELSWLATDIGLNPHDIIQEGQIQITQILGYDDGADVVVFYAFPPTWQSFSIFDSRIVIDAYNNMSIPRYELSLANEVWIDRSGRWNPAAHPYPGTTIDFYTRFKGITVLKYLGR